MTRPSATTASTPTATAPASSDPGYTRLHISPLDADLLSVIVPGSIRSDARNISYHGLQSFPEKRYGYVDLPSAAADKLRNKLNGAVLKGVKLRIQPARTRKKEEDGWAPRKQSDDDDSMAGFHRTRGRRENKDFMQSATFGLTTWRRLGGAAASEEIPGIQLEVGRQVKRGWTEGEDEKIARKKAKKEERNSSKSKKSADKPKTEQKMRQRAAKYTDKKECLMKTILPPKAMAAEKAAAAAAAPTTADAAAVVPEEEDEETRARRRKRDKRARHVVVHEFAHSTKFPTFLRSAGDGAAPLRANLEFVDGKGWVDGTGDVVEAMLSTRPAVVTAKIETEALKAKIEKVRKAQIVSSDDSSDTSDSGDSISSSGESSEEEEEEEDEDEDDENKETKMAEAPPMVERPKSSSSSKGLTIQIPAAVEVHPLEALYKKTKATAVGDDKTRGDADADKTAAEPFSFFGGSDDVDDADDGDDDGQPQPTTPYTEKELEWRHVRSAAPTPDTAHPSRSGSGRWPFGDRMEEDDDDNDDDENDNEAGATRDKEAAVTDDPTADFESWFWDNRGDLNRAWKRRRKTAAKEKRYRDNKARAGRAI
ncbi:hypothetical protein CMQ_7441 [Grosmannia clavigera kw1407]|uniref:Suppressor protein srp40 n=1 Tax=Grosmannia clavigera (strain kw1407 / UAMH 11150) TaxID=655863 RepID=F0XP78_GROCL|nr:uncharacterized protein CMQ_7441 [Grosmannia clavigera kw1407]EFX00439.1 hypothetical protein CMQ_7441 [Grosmannia clavigera kw1407]